MPLINTETAQDPAYYIEKLSFYEQCINEKGVHGLSDAKQALKNFNTVYQNFFLPNESQRGLNDKLIPVILEAFPKLVRSVQFYEPDYVLMTPLKQAFETVQFTQAVKAYASVQQTVFKESFRKPVLSVTPMRIAAIYSELLKLSNSDSQERAPKHVVLAGPGLLGTVENPVPIQLTEVIRFLPEGSFITILDNDPDVITACSKPFDAYAGMELQLTSFLAATELLPREYYPYETVKELLLNPFEKNVQVLCHQLDLKDGDLNGVPEASVIIAVHSLYFALWDEKCNIYSHVHSWGEPEEQLKADNQWFSFSMTLINKYLDKLEPDGTLFIDEFVITYCVCPFPDQELPPGNQPLDYFQDLVNKGSSNNRKIQVTKLVQPYWGSLPSTGRSKTEYYDPKTGKILTQNISEIFAVKIVQNNL